MDEQTLKADVREQTGYTETMILSDGALDTAYRNAKRHLRTSAGLPKESNYDWFDVEYPEREDALYWWTCIFSKVATGELDSQTVQVGAVDAETLLAKAGEDVTQWYRKAVSTQRTLAAASDSGGIFRVTSVVRDDRTYGSDDDGTTSGLGSDNLTGG